MKNPNSCNSKPYSAALHKKQGPNIIYTFFKKVFMLLLKCELAYSTPAFSQGIFIGFNEIAHANSEDVTEGIMHIDTCGLFKNNNKKKKKKKVTQSGAMWPPPLLNPPLVWRSEF